MLETKIEWCDSVWNPVTGCRHECPYCYARGIAERFGGYDPQYGAGMTKLDGNYTLGANERKYIRRADGKRMQAPYPFGFEPTLHTYRLEQPQKWVKPQTIFVCSMADLFGAWVPDEWIKAVFDACKQAPQHTYMFLTKNPARYVKLAQCGELPKDSNFWYGSTVTDDSMPFFTSGSHNCFVSVEPLLSEFEYGGGAALIDVNWIIIGAMTGPGCKKHRPERRWIESIVEEAHGVSVPVFMKDSLAPIWGAGLIREYPPEMLKVTTKPAPLPRCKTCEHAEPVQQGKRGTACACGINWEAEGDIGRGARNIPGRYTRTSPPWCPKRKEKV